MTELERQELERQILEQIRMKQLAYKRAWNAANSHFGRDRTDGDSRDIIEKIELGNLLVANKLCHKEQHAKRRQRGQAQNQKIHAAIPLSLYFGRNRNENT